MKSQRSRRGSLPLCRLFTAGARFLRVGLLLALLPTLLFLPLSWVPASSVRGKPGGAFPRRHSLSRGAKQRTALRNWLQEFIDGGFDVAAIFSPKPPWALNPPRKEEEESDGVLSKVRDLLGSQENILGKELRGLQSQIGTLDARFSDVQQRLRDSEEREGLLGKRLTTALKHESELNFAVESAKNEYGQVADELETLQLVEENLKKEIRQIQEREQDLLLKEVVLGAELEELRPLKALRAQLLEAQAQGK
ncbi:unnamed protein product, partial [Polarella glacialis]